MKYFIFTVWSCTLVETLYIIVTAEDYEEAYGKAFYEASNADYVEDYTLEYHTELYTDTVIVPGIYSNVLS